MVSSYTTVAVVNAPPDTDVKEFAEERHFLQGACHFSDINPVKFQGANRDYCIVTCQRENMQYVPVCPRKTRYLEVPAGVDVPNHGVTQRRSIVVQTNGKDHTSGGESPASESRMKTHVLQEWGEDYTYSAFLEKVEKKEIKCPRLYLPSPDRWARYRTARSWRTAVL